MYLAIAVFAPYRVVTVSYLLTISYPLWCRKLYMIAESLVAPKRFIASRLVILPCSCKCSSTKLSCVKGINSPPYEYLFHTTPIASKGIPNIHCISAWPKLISPICSAPMLQKTKTAPMMHNIFFISALLLSPHIRRLCETH